MAISIVNKRTVTLDKSDLVAAIVQYLMSKNQTPPANPEIVLLLGEDFASAASNDDAATVAWTTT